MEGGLFSLVFAVQIDLLFLFADFGLAGLNFILMKLSVLKYKNQYQAHFSLADYKHFY